jgi:hypothetical protein
VPVSDAAARRAAAWLAAWYRAGLLGTDPEVRAYVADLVAFVGERAMSEGACENTTAYRHECSPAEAERYGGYCLDCANAGVPDLLARVRELEADNARLRGMVDELRAGDPAYELAKATAEFPAGGGK